MPVGIVEELEVVQVQHGDGERRVLALGAVGLLFQTLVEGPVVQEPGQRVVVGPLQGLGQQPLPLRLQRAPLPDLGLAVSCVRFRQIGRPLPHAHFQRAFGLAQRLLALLELRDVAEGDDDAVDLRLRQQVQHDDVAAAPGPILVADRRFVVKFLPARARVCANTSWIEAWSSGEIRSNRRFPVSDSGA